MARGRGELVDPGVAPAFDWVVVTFSFGVSTAEAFGWWDEDSAPTGPDPAPLLEWLRVSAAPGPAGRPKKPLRSLIYNDLQGPVMRRHPQMQADEAVLIRCFDSAQSGAARFSAHGAFDDPQSPPDAPPRESIEVRALVFFAD